MTLLRRGTLDSANRPLASMTASASPGIDGTDGRTLEFL